MEAFLPADCLLTPETQTLREIFSQLTSQEQTQAISHLAKLFGPQRNTQPKPIQFKAQFVPEALLSEGRRRPSLPHDGTLEFCRETANSSKNTLERLHQSVNDLLISEVQQDKEQGLQFTNAQTLLSEIEKYPTQAMTENRKIMGVLLEEANNQISEVKQSERTITVPTTSGDVNSDLQGFANQARKQLLQEHLKTLELRTQVTRKQQELNETLGKKVARKVHETCDDNHNQQVKMQMNIANELLLVEKQTTVAELNRCYKRLEDVLRQSKTQEAASDLDSGAQTDFEEKRKAMLRLLEAKREEIIASFGTLKLMKTENGDVVSSKVLPKIAQTINDLMRAQERQEGLARKLKHLFAQKTIGDEPAVDFKLEYLLDQRVQLRSLQRQLEADQAPKFNPFTASMEQKALSKEVLGVGSSLLKDCLRQKQRLSLIQNTLARKVM